MQWQELLNRASEWISYLETERIRDTIVHLDQQGFMILGGATALLVILCLIKRMIRVATLIVALCAVTVLLHFTIPEKGQPMGLQELVTLFIGGTFIVASAVYIIFIRAD
jgi:RsiW-degrading membrane proteinase PrsW (M82 family)